MVNFKIYKIINVSNHVKLLKFNTITNVWQNVQLGFLYFNINNNAYNNVQMALTGILINVWIVIKNVLYVMKGWILNV